jgi:hypothetical protein
VSLGHDGYRHDAGHESVATLVRSVPVRLVEVSRGGCRLECASRIESGTSGQLAVELLGLMRIDDIRVARCQQRMGAGEVFHVGAELLRTRRLGRRTVRMAVRKIISSERDVGEARVSQAPVPQETPPGEVSVPSEGRAPPLLCDS